MAKALRWAAILAVGMVQPMQGADLEWRPAVAGGYSKVVDSHGSIGVALRLQVVRFFFAQAEYLVLPADDHTDHGPTALLGLSGTRAESIRPYIGVGGGPVRGVSDDDGLVYVAVGASYPLARRHRVFAQGEFRYGALGETTYSQLTIGLGLSR
jgi:hypothetical protein